MIDESTEFEKQIKGLFIGIALGLLAAGMAGLFGYYVLPELLGLHHVK